MSFPGESPWGLCCQHSIGREVVMEHEACPAEQPLCSLQLIGTWVRWAFLTCIEAHLKLIHLYRKPNERRLLDFTIYDIEGTDFSFWNWKKAKVGNQATLFIRNLCLRFLTCKMNRIISMVQAFCRTYRRNRFVRWRRVCVCMCYCNDSQF
jgi:hypothetical protein